MDSLDDTINSFELVDIIMADIDIERVLEIEGDDGKIEQINSKVCHSPIARDLGAGLSHIRRENCEDLCG